LDLHEERRHRQHLILREVGATIGTMYVGPTGSMAAGVSLPPPSTRIAARFSARAPIVTLRPSSWQHRNARRAVSWKGAAEAAPILIDRATALARPGPTGFLARADEARRIALGTYREGAIPLFQVIDATRVWADARMTYYNTLIAQQRSVLALMAAEGTDLLAAPLLRTGGRSR
jgi:hypothetical protein